MSEKLHFYFVFFLHSYFIICKKDCKWRLVEEFGPECFSVQQDGKLLFHADYTDKDNLITWLLSFREKVELLEPEEIREEIKVSIECIKKKYEGEISVIK